MKYVKIYLSLFSTLQKCIFIDMICKKITCWAKICYRPKDQQKCTHISFCHLKSYTVNRNFYAEMWCMYAVVVICVPGSDRRYWLSSLPYKWGYNRLPNPFSQSHNAGFFSKGILLGALKNQLLTVIHRIDTYPLGIQ